MRVPRWAYALVIIGGILCVIGVITSIDPDAFGLGQFIK